MAAVSRSKSALNLVPNRTRRSSDVTGVTGKMGNTSVRRARSKSSDRKKSLFNRLAGMANSDHGLSAVGADDASDASDGLESAYKLTDDSDR